MTDSLIAALTLVPFTPDDATDEQITHRLRTNARPQMPTIAVHEAYPGHHWHSAWVAAQGPAHPLRKVFRTSYFSEGWALYSEKLLRSVGYYRTKASLMGHVEARLFRAARARAWWPPSGARWASSRTSPPPCSA